MKRVWLRHLALGISLSALLHTILQFAYSYSARFDNDWDVFPIHWAAGVLFGSVILGPAYTVQALISVGLERRKAGRFIQIAAGGFMQASLVWLWSQSIGIEPSLSGNFALTQPMIAAGFVAGAAVAVYAAPKNSGTEPHP